LILFTISHGKFSAPFRTYPFYTTTGIGHWFLCAFNCTIYYFIYKVKGNIGNVGHRIVQNISQTFDVLRMIKNIFVIMYLDAT